MEQYLPTDPDPGALRAGFAFCRSLLRDAGDNGALHAGGIRQSTPVFAIGGGRTDAYRRAGKIEQSVRRVAADIRGLVAEERGPFVPEEDPNLTTRASLGQVDRWA